MSTSVILLTGPVGAGKTAISRELVPLLPGAIAAIEGDTFWSFLAKQPETVARRERFRTIIRSMLAASVPLARSGYDVVLDFTIPPQFLKTARTILKELPLDLVVIRPSATVCAARAASRKEGRIDDYGDYQDLYDMFEDDGPNLLADDEASPRELARRIAEGLSAGRFRVARVDEAAHD